MLRAPTLAFLADAVVEHQHALAVNAVNHRFENPRPTLDSVDTGNILEAFAKALAGIFFELLLVKLNVVLRVLGLRFVVVMDHYFVELSGAFFKVDDAMYLTIDLQVKFEILVAEVPHFDFVTSKAQSGEAEISLKVGHLSGLRRLQHDGRADDGLIGLIVNLTGEDPVASLGKTVDIQCKCGYEQ